MPAKITIRSALCWVMATTLLGLVPVSAPAQTAGSLSADRALVERAMADLEAAERESARIDARLAEARTELDRVMSQRRRAGERLGSRVRMMYVSGDHSFVWLLLGAGDFQDFVTRWTLLMRMNERDATDIATLRAAQRTARETASSLMALQAEQARATDRAAAQLAQARRTLAQEEAALAAYEARAATRADAEPVATPSDSTPQGSGTGAWSTGVASHFGRDFTGTGSSGEAIGPYSMMVAHRTFPFGTLVEFEYEGRRAVASVEDRGPHVEGRMWDLGPGVVRTLDFAGVHEVRWRVIGG